MTYAETQAIFWQLQVTAHLTQLPRAIPDRFTPQTAKAGRVLDAINAFQPFDFVQGSSWFDILEAWLSRPKSTARSLAVAAVVDVIQAQRDYRDYSQCGQSTVLPIVSAVSDYSQHSQ